MIQRKDAKTQKRKSWYVLHNQMHYHSTFRVGKQGEKSTITAFLKCNFVSPQVRPVNPDNVCVFPKLQPEVLSLHDPKLREMVVVYEIDVLCDKDYQD